MAKILDGKKLSREIADELGRKIKRLKTKPKLVIIQVGNSPESNKYIERKKKFGAEIGAIVEHLNFPTNLSRKKLFSVIQKLNKDEKVYGIIVQKPLPKHLEGISENIAEEKKVDGGKHFIPATTLGILTILEKYGIKLRGKKVVVVGRSNLVGKPTALAMIDRGATVTVCHRQTRDLRKETRQADVLIVAAGHKKLITKNHVSSGQIVIDVGINFSPDGEIVGDVDFQSVSKIVRAISPVPGGIGPMTVASLFQNLLIAWFHNNNKL